jgi:peptidoglycan/LPS O-acetylase OafA/YrhL
VAALHVVIFHGTFWLAGLLDAAPDVIGHVTRTGYVSVGFFFMLSGFVLAYAYATGDGQRIDRRRFWAARVARIYPVYAVSLAVGAVPALLELLRHEPARAAVVRFGAYLVANVLMLSAWYPPSAVINYPAWSLSAEAFFYALFPWALVTVWRIPLRRMPWVITGLAAAGVAIPLVACVLVPAFWHWPATDCGPTAGASLLLADVVASWPIFRAGEFLIGICLGRIYLSQDVAASPWRLWLSAGAVVAVLMIANRVPYLVLHDGLLDLPLALLILESARDNSWFSRVFSSRGMVLLGEASYALYILHVPTRDWLRAVIGRVDAMHRVPDPVWFVLYLSIVIGVSIASFLLIERPAREWIKLRLHAPSASLTASTL